MSKSVIFYRGHDLSSKVLEGGGVETNLVRGGQGFREDDASQAVTGVVQTGHHQFDVGVMGSSRHKIQQPKTIFQKELQF